MTWIFGTYRFGIVVAISLTFDVVYVNIIPLLAWVVAASVTLLMRQAATAAAPEIQHHRANAPVPAQR